MENFSSMSSMSSKSILDPMNSMKIIPVGNWAGARPVVGGAYFDVDVVADHILSPDTGSTHSDTCKNPSFYMIWNFNQDTRRIQRRCKDIIAEVELSFRDWKAENPLVDSKKYYISKVESTLTNRVPGYVYFIVARQGELRQIPR